MNNRHRFILRPVSALPAPDLYLEFIDPPTWSFPPPPLSLPKHLLYRWSCSIASLNGVRKLRKSLRGGMQLEYGDHAVCLGDFRLSEALTWISSPGWLRISSGSGYKQSIEFYKENVDCTDGLMRMEGYIIVWFCQRDILIQIDNSNNPSMIDGAM
jgi:hypothetical protein